MALTAACFGRDVERDGWPTVSVIMPIRNEAEHLETAVASVLAQDYPIPFDVCLAVGPSDDDTESVAAHLAERESRVLVVPNPAGVTPVALNTAIAATTGEVVLRVDGHAELSDGYIRRAVETMIRTGAVNVGGMQVPTPETPFEEAVAAATTSWLGTGGASYRVGGDEGPVDTVYLGVFDRVAGDAAGWFAPDLIRNQDYELNIRLRQQGGTVWFDPQLSVGYRPRGTWLALAKQYFEYGYWKAEVLRRHPDSLRARQLAPIVVWVAISVALLLGARRRRFLAVPAGYLGVLAVGASGRPARAAIAGCMHASWAAGFGRSVAALVVDDH
jgi:glycosyltransferase involved in cell wall biosynthesis